MIGAPSAIYENTNRSSLWKYCSFTITIRFGKKYEAEWTEQKGSDDLDEVLSRWSCLSLERLPVIKQLP